MVKGYIYALLAAIFNGMIGIFSVKLMFQGLSPYAISFYKCFIAFAILTTYLYLSGQFSSWISYMKKMWWKLFITSFFGFFVLYFFETAAYKCEKVPMVVFLLLGSSLITTFFLSSLLDRRKLSSKDLISCLLGLVGLGFIFGLNIGENVLGIFLALLAGIGYGAFLTLSPRYQIGSGFIVVNSLMFYGMLFLFIPFANDELVLINDPYTLLLMTFLALLPTIGGFLCTTKALTLLSSESVQLVELSEPIFALAFAFVFLQQSITGWELFGGLLLMTSIYIHSRTEQKVILE